jgi:catechol 2,3-dioxygenase-like lactoylglutathione lyase family enzyme
MLDHVGIRASDRPASEGFYDTVLDALGIGQGHNDEEYVEWGDFAMGAASDAVGVTRHLHVAFTASSRALVDAFWEAGTSAGFRSDGEPGPRPVYRDDYYGGFLLDPDGNSVEAVHHGDVAGRGMIDHLWIRVADVAAAGGFYALVAPHAGLRLREETPELIRYWAGDASFTLVRGDPTTSLHMAFAGDDAAVHAFHAVAVEAGYRSNGPPGERLIYHPGYYAAFVLDPDGNNVEVVNHHR